MEITNHSKNLNVAQTFECLFRVVKIQIYNHNGNTVTP